MSKRNEATCSEALKLRIEQKLSLSEISKKTGLSKSTLSVLLRDYPLDKEIISSRLKEHYKHSLGDITKYKDKKKPRPKNILIKEGFETFWDKIPSYKRGLVGEAFVKYQLLRRGIEVLEPSVLEPGCDVVVHTNKYYRCEIKSSTSNEVGISRTKFKSNGGYIKNDYTDRENIDFFICVLLNREEVFIIPYEVTLNYAKTLFLGSTGIFTKYKDRYDQFYGEIVV